MSESMDLLDRLLRIHEEVQLRREDMATAATLLVARGIRALRQPDPVLTDTQLWESVYAAAVKNIVADQAADKADEAVRVRAERRFRDDAQAGQ